MTRELFSKPRDNLNLSWIEYSSIITTVKGLISSVQRFFAVLRSVKRLWLLRTQLRSGALTHWEIVINVILVGAG